MTKKKPNNVLPLVDKKIEFFENVRLGNLLALS